MRRDSMLREFDDWWRVVYKDTGNRVPPDEAQDILNKLIDNGFEVQIKASVGVEGVSEFLLYAFDVEVTRIVKK